MQSTFEPLLPHEKWSLNYQAWRIARLNVLLQTHTRTEALKELAAEEVGRPWQTYQPLPALN